MADETNVNTDDVDTILNLSIDVADIAASETDSLRPSPRSARRISGMPISEEEAAREKRRQRTKFAQDIHGSNVVSSVSSDFQNGTFVGELYGTENPWLQKYAPFYYPQNPLPTQLNHQPDGPPPAHIRQVHIGDTVLVPPKVEYSDQVLRTIHDAKLRSLPMPKEVHPVTEEEEEVYEEEVSEYEEQPQKEHTEYGPPQQEHTEYGPPQQEHTEYGPPQKEHTEYGPPQQEHTEYGPPQQEHTEYGPPQQKHTEYGPPQQEHTEYGPPQQEHTEYGPPQQEHTEYGPPQQEHTEYGHEISDRVEEPSQYSSDTGGDDDSEGDYEWKPKGAPGTENTQSSAGSTQHGHNANEAPKDSGLSSRPGPPYHDTRPPPGFPFTQHSSVFVPQGPQHPTPQTPSSPGSHPSRQNPTQPEPSTGHNNQAGPTTNKDAANHTVKRNSQREPKRPAPGQNIGGGLFSPIRSSQRSTTRPTHKHIQARPVFHPPSTPSLQTTIKPSRVQPSPPRTSRPRYRTTPRSTAKSEIVQDNGYTNRVKPDDVIPFSLSYGYEVVVPTTTPAPPPLSQYGKPKASTILGATLTDSEDLSGPAAPILSTRPLDLVETTDSGDADGFGAPRPDNVISAPLQVQQSSSPEPPTPAREGYTRPVTSGDVSPTPAAPRGQDSLDQVTASVARPGYAAPKDADIIDGAQRPAGERITPFRALNSVRNLESAPTAASFGERKSDTEDEVFGDYMRPKQDDILSEDQAAGFVRSRYFPQPTAVPNEHTNTRTRNGYGSPKKENVIGNGSDQEFGLRTTSLQFKNAPEGTESEAQNGFSRPKDADIVGFKSNSLLKGESAPAAPSRPEERRPEPSHGVREFSSPRLGDLVEQSENSIINGDGPFPASGSLSHTRSISEFGPKGYSKPKDADVLSSDENSAGVNVSEKTPDVNDGSDSGAQRESFSEAKPLVINPAGTPQTEDPEEPEVTPDVSGFGPLRSETVIQPDEGAKASPAPTDDVFGAPRPQYILSETSPASGQSQSPRPTTSTTEAGPSQPRDVRRPSTDLYTVDDFLRSEDVSILGAFRTPGSPQDTRTRDDGIAVTTQRSRAAQKPAADRPANAGFGWSRRSDPGPFRAQAALLDAQFADLFVDEPPPPRRRQQSRRPAVRRQPAAARRRPVKPGFGSVAARRRPVEPEFGPPFAILESRADHGWPIAEDEPEGPVKGEKGSTPLKFGSAFAAEPLTPPGLFARRRSTVAPPRSRSRQRSTEAPTRGRPRQRPTSAPSRGRTRHRPTEAPRGVFSEQLSPFADEFAAPFAAPAASRLSVTAVRPGQNPIPDWPKITEEW